MSTYEVLFHVHPTALTGTPEQSTSVKTKDKIQAVPERLPLGMGSSLSGAEVINNHFHFPAQQFPYNTVIQALMRRLNQKQLQSQKYQKPHKC